MDRDRRRRAGGRWGRPGIVAFEYGGVGERYAWRSDYNVLADQVPILHALLHR